MNDWRGTPVTRGCTVVYPGRRSSHLWMTEGRVEAFGEGFIVVRRTHLSVGGLRDDGVSMLTVLDKVTVVE